MRAWTVDENGFDPTLYRQPEPITVSSAICPSVDPLGVESIDRQGNRIHFDTWYEWWANTVSTWLGSSLRELNDTLEDQLVAWPEKYRNGCYELAWMYFLACTHESMWSQQPLTNPNGDPQSWPPEDFVVSESIQQRHAWVYLNASIWAEWSGGQPSGGMAQTYVIGGTEPSQYSLSGGPLLQLVQEQGTADPYWPGEHSPSQRGTYWDHDCLPTIVLYNRSALVVIDRNGGRITEVFSWVVVQVRDLECHVGLADASQAVDRHNSVGGKEAADGAHHLVAPSEQRVAWWQDPYQLPSCCWLPVQRGTLIEHGVL